MVAKILPRENSEEIKTDSILVSPGLESKGIEGLKSREKAAELLCCL